MTTCDICTNSTTKTQKLDCILTKGGDKITVTLEMCSKCNNPQSIPKLVKWVILGVSLLLIFTIASIFLDKIDFNFLPIFLAAFMSIFLKGCTIMLIYSVLKKLLGLSDKHYFTYCRNNSKVKSLLDSGYQIDGVKIL